MKQLFLILLFVVGLSSCAAQKKSVKVQERKVLQTQSTIDIDKSELLSSLSIDRLTVLEDIVLEKLSTPDSSGKQYVVERSTIKRTTGKLEKIAQISEIQAAVCIDSSFVLKNDVEIEAKQNKQTSGWIIALATVGISAVVIIIMWILSKLKIL